MKPRAGGSRVVPGLHRDWVGRLHPSFAHRSFDGKRVYGFIGRASRVRTSNGASENRVGVPALSLMGFAERSFAHGLLASN